MRHRRDSPYAIDFVANDFWETHRKKAHMLLSWRGNCKIESKSYDKTSTVHHQILDEVFRILNYIATTHPLGRAYKVTDELFDLSTMAMEYFNKDIEPTLPEITYFGSDFLDFTPPFATPSKRLQLPLNNVGFDSPISSRASAVGSSCSEPPLPYNNRK